MQRTFAATTLVALASMACATLEQPLPTVSLLEAQDASAEGRRLQQEGQYAQAARLLERALEIRESSLGRRHPEVASSLHALATLYMQQRFYTRAESLLLRALEIRREARGKDALEVATSLHALAERYSSQGLSERARPLYERALEIQEVALATHHPDVASTLHTLASLYAKVGRYTNSVLLHERGLALQESALGENHPDIATSLLTLADLLAEQGLYTRAEAEYQRALEIRGSAPPGIASILQGLGNLYATQGFHARAEPLLQRALDIREATLGGEHPDFASSLHSLANLYTAQGLYTRAESLHERALKIRQRSDGKDKLAVASSLTQLANIRVTQGLHAQAEKLFQEALELRESALGPNHPDVATSLHGLANLYAAQGLHARASPLYERILEIREAAFGRRHPALASSLRDLATLEAGQSRYERAGPLYAHALAIQQATFGERHPEIARTLNHLALLRLAQHDLAEALPLFSRAFTISERHSRREAFGFSEARVDTFLHTLRADEDRLYSLVRAHAGDADVRRLALTAVLLRKGRSAEELSQTSRVVSLHLGGADRATFERLRELRTQFSELSLARPGMLAQDEYQKRLEELGDWGDALESELARHSAPFRELYALPPPAGIIDAVAAALPKDGVLIEFVLYLDSPLTPSTVAFSREPRRLRYLALLLLPDGRIRTADLGLADAIDDTARQLHDALRRRSASYPHTARQLYARIFRPLLPLIGNVRRLLLAPDGQLSLVPFAALHDGSHFLVDSFDITYLTSGRDLLSRNRNISPETSIIALADPDFSSTSHQDPSPFVPLAGTRKEAEAIQRLFPRAKLLLGRAATKEALLTLKPPGILHIASHGFFLEERAAAVGLRTSEALRAPISFRPIHEVGPLPSNPMLRSGLILSGERSPFPLQDSHVTALELAGMNLWGTQLVVLSACDTGLGEATRGQGIYGMRRAMLMAGAETLVASLWNIADLASAELMTAYYHNLRAGLGRSAALRLAMLAHREQYPHPHYWAPFITLGRDAPLQGVVP